MKFRSIISCMAVAYAATAFPSPPVVSGVTMSQAQSRLVTIGYTLDSSAVVTLDVQTNVVLSSGATNWVSIGGAALTNVTGEVNRLVVEDGNEHPVHSIWWHPDRSWPGHLIRNNGARAVVRAWAPDAPPDWMMINLGVKSNVTYYASIDSLPFGHPSNSVYKLDYLLMRKIPAAGRSFRMGLAYGESRLVGGTSYTKMAPRMVSFTNDYYFAIFQLTARQYFLITGGNPGYYSNNVMTPPYDECPATGFSYSGLRGSPLENGCEWASDGHAVKAGSVIDKIRLYTGVDVDLSTEAQWEYACRAGEDRLRYDGVSGYTSQGLDDICWNKANSTNGNNVAAMHPVGSRKPNAWFIYDMYGNGYEWCLDYYVDGYAGCGTVDPAGPATASKYYGSNPYMVMRSTDVLSTESAMYSANRGTYWATLNDKQFSLRLAAPAVAKRPGGRQ